MARYEPVKRLDLSIIVDIAQLINSRKFKVALNHQALGFALRKEVPRGELAFKLELEQVLQYKSRR